MRRRRDSSDESRIDLAARLSPYVREDLVPTDETPGRDGQGAAELDEEPRPDQTA